MSLTKLKGNIAETKILADLISLGYTVSIPYGEDVRYDLVVDVDNKFLRIQCKYTTSNLEFVYIKARSTNNWKTIVYNNSVIDVIATYDSSTDKIYYVPISEFKENQSSIQLRLTPSKNNQKLRTRKACDFLQFPPF